MTTSIVPKPMLATSLDGQLPAKPDEWALEGKFDGWRMLGWVGDATVDIYGGRNAQRYTKQIPYIEEALCGQLPPHTIVDGELYSPKGTAGAVTTVMRSSKPHVPSVSSPGLTFVIFDVLEFRGQDVRHLTWEQRRILLSVHPFEAPLHLSPVGECSMENHLKMLDLGLEGSVLKRKASRYAPGRSHDWIKVKSVESEDCVITGVALGEGAGNRGEAGSFMITLPSGVVTTIKVPDDKTIAEATANPGAFVGRMVEVAHNGVMDSGKLRHPRFLRWREDRDKPVPAPKPQPSRSGPATKKMRAYSLMGSDKLLAAVHSLNQGRGEAYEIAMSGKHAGDLSDHIAAATAAAVKKGLM